jgi:hypothetical protein
MNTNSILISRFLTSIGAVTGIYPKTLSKWYRSLGDNETKCYGEWTYRIGYEPKNYPELIKSDRVQLVWYP